MTLSPPDSEAGSKVSEAAVSLKGFSFQYQAHPAVRDLSLEVQNGIIHGLIGPDGAGKTTVMRSICTLLDVAEGSVSVFGLEVNKHRTEIRSRLGYMPQRFSLYQDLTVEENLRFFARLFGIPEQEYARRRETLYSFSRLGPFQNRRAKALSGGMKQKLALSCALVHAPELLVLDEPTFGVDPVSRMEFWDILHDLKKQGSTILVSTAYMDEAEKCDHVTLLHKGRILLDGDPARILKNWTTNIYSLGSDAPRELARFLASQPEVLSSQFFGADLHITAKEEIGATKFRSWQAQCPSLRKWEKIPAGMEDIFLELMENDQDR